MRSATLALLVFRVGLVSNGCEGALSGPQPSACCEQRRLHQWIEPPSVKKQIPISRIRPIAGTVGARLAVGGRRFRRCFSRPLLWCGRGPSPGLCRRAGVRGNEECRMENAEGGRRNGAGGIGDVASAVGARRAEQLAADFPKPPLQLATVAGRVPAHDSGGQDEFVAERRRNGTASFQ